MLAFLAEYWFPITVWWGTSFAFFLCYATKMDKLATFFLFIFSFLWPLFAVFLLVYRITRKIK